SDPAHGSVTLNADGTFSYSHDGSETTSDSFTYKTCDNGTTNGSPDPKCSGTATVSVTVTPVNDATAANVASATVAECGKVTVLAITAYSVHANDTHPPSPTRPSTNLSDPAHGSVTLNANGTFSYSHDGSETATDSFTYKACDNGTTGSPPVADPKCSGTATVSITVTPVNDAPVANSDSATTNEDTPVDVNVLANDTDPDNANSDLQTVSLRNVTGGSAIVLSDGRTVRFSPNTDANSSDGSTFKFTYKANDGALDSASAAIVTITVNPVNDVPSFTRGADQTVNEDSGAHTALGWATNLSKGTANESGQTLDFIVSNNNNGLFSGQPAVSSTGTLTFTSAPNANGVATVTVKIHDDGGTANGGVDTSAPQTVTITVTPVNDGPVLTISASSTGGQYSDQTSPVIALTATDIDNMGSQLTFSVDAPGLPAGLVLTPAAGSTAPASPSSPGTRTATISGPLRVAPSTYLRT